MKSPSSHPSLLSGASQCAKILRELKRKRGSWVAMPRLYNVSGAFAVHSRCSELRGRGHIILQENRRRGRKILSFYKLISIA